MADEFKMGVNPPPPAIVPNPQVSGEVSSQLDAAASGLFASLSVVVPQDVSGAYEKYADREAHLGEEIR